MKKILIGAGIGFAALVLIAVVAGGLWAKSKVDGFVEEAEARTEQFEKNEKRVSELETKYAFQAPPKGVPVSVTEGRLHEYLAVRTALRPVYETYAKQAKELEHRADGDPGVGEAIEAMGQLTAFLGTLQETWLTQLDSKKMSPREYHAITAALYSSNWGAVQGDLKRSQRPMLEQLKKSLDEQLAQAPEGEMRAMLQEQIKSVDEQLAALPPADAEPSEAEKVHKANHALYTKYQKQIEDQAEHGLDVLLLAGAGEALENAFDGLVAEEEPAGEEAPE